MTITEAAPQDAQEILDLQRLAYQSEAAIYNDYAIPPLTQTLAELEAQFHNHIFLKAMAAGRLIGSVIAHLQGETCFIGRLIVHRDYQNRPSARN